ncbi:hypothetical protein ASPSYDRAFT_638184 [Aspergillus sydowii CBS 593.65]|uniref:Uncharacterized protein n=1 Tax=Aspergillus sydowii CBS 593.65 TaxID=1036612 RepID=A0A1L9TSB1_9EURO|nr:uncharacterized protein ASPSYDRAFT_638184 [Aspergillus sydowii CBS 593.65]OJJ62324.1 hypothetical protein ASPSYDRAFT_638184 [Aspergillus sydowii CBS 593.65]
MARRLTTNQKIAGSIPASVNRFLFFPLFYILSWWCFFLFRKRKKKWERTLCMHGGRRWQHCAYIMHRMHTGLCGVLVMPKRAKDSVCKWR